MVLQLCQSTHMAMICMAVHDWRMWLLLYLSSVPHNDANLDIKATHRSVAYNCPKAAHGQLYSTCFLF